MRYDINDDDELVATVDRCEFRSKSKKLELEINMKNCECLPAKPSIGKTPILELKNLLPHLRYVFLGKYNTLLWHISIGDK